MVMIFIAEYVTGIWLTGAGICPWDYSRWPDNVDGVIRLNFAPLWFFTGLLFERITKSKSRSISGSGFVRQLSGASKAVLGDSASAAIALVGTRLPVAGVAFREKSHVPHLPGHAAGAAV